MARPAYYETLVKKVVVIAERQWIELRERAEATPGGNVSQLVREAIDRWITDPASETPTRAPQSKEA